MVIAAVEVIAHNESTDGSNGFSFTNFLEDSYWGGRHPVPDKLRRDTECAFVFPTLGAQTYFNNNITYVQLVPALLLMFFFALVSRNGKPWKTLRTCRPSVPVYAFGLVVWSLMQVIFTGKSLYEWGYQSKFHAMKMILHCILIGAVFWPMMAAINTRYLPAQIIGCLYVWWCAVCAILVSLPCEFKLSDTIMVGIEMLPLYAFLLYICVLMPVRMLRCMRKRKLRRNINNWLNDHKDNYSVKHVKRVMRLSIRRSAEAQGEEEAAEKVKEKHHQYKSPFLNPLLTIEAKLFNADDKDEDDATARKDRPKTHEQMELDALNEQEKQILNARFYRVLPGFRYSLNILFAVVGTQTAVFLLAVSGFRYHSVLLNAALRFIEALSIVMRSTPRFLTGNKTIPVVELAQQFNHSTIRDYARTPIFTSIILAYLLNLLAMLLTMRHYRKQLVYLYHGRHVDKIPEYEKTKSAAAILTHSAKFIGYQLGFGIYAYFVHMFWLIMILGGIWTNVILIVVKGRTEIIWHVLKHIIPIILYIVVMRFGQKLLVYYCFCQKCHRKKDKRVLALDNRHCYMNYHYFMVFFNAPLGIFVAFGRLIKMFIYSLWTMPRCDIPSLSKDFESADSGYKTYVCMLMMENALTNPMLVVFSQLCSIRRADRQGADKRFFPAHHAPPLPFTVCARRNLYNKHTAGEPTSIIVGDSARLKAVTEAATSLTSPLTIDSRRRARIRWHLFYTLHNNPLLRAYRKHQHSISLPIMMTLRRDPESFDIYGEHRLLRNLDDVDLRPVRFDPARGRAIDHIVQQIIPF